MALWKIDEEEGEGMYRGWWCEKCVSVHVCLRLLFASSSKWHWRETALQKDFSFFFFLHVAEAIHQCLLAAGLN